LNESKEIPVTRSTSATVHHNRTSDHKKKRLSGSDRIKKESGSKDGSKDGNLDSDGEVELPYARKQVHKHKPPGMIYYCFSFLASSSYLHFLDINITSGT
jgi:hypothetical protein